VFPGQDRLIPRLPSGRPDVNRHPFDFLRLACALLAFFSAPVLLCAVLFLFDLPLSPYFLVGSFVALGFYYLRKPFDPVGSGVALALVGSAFFLSGLSLDTSWDGLAYHQAAIMHLAEGVNPVLDRFTDLMGKWTNAYPKASWYFSSVVYRVTGDIQYGKAYHLLLLFAALAYGQHVFREQGLVARALAALACLNPVALCQVPSFYVDGALASLMAICLLYLWKWSSGKDGFARQEHVLFVMSLIVLANLKFTGLVYATMTALWVLGCAWRQSRARAAEILRRVLLPAAAGVLLVGCSPYVTHLLEGKHLFHPVAGADKTDIISRIAPRGFAEMNRLEKLGRSLAARTGFASATRSPVLKAPFAVSADELTAMDGPDVRVGGFGPLFSGILVVSLGVGLVWRAGLNPWVLSLLAAMTLVNAEAWWARLAPFLWLLPLFLVSGYRTPRLACWTVLLLLSANVLLSGVSIALSAQRETAALHELLSAHTGSRCWIRNSYFTFRPTLERYGIIEEPGERHRDDDWPCPELLYEAEVCCMPE